jgi:AI-2 transport protein TqsA
MRRQRRKPPRPDPRASVGAAPSALPDPPPGAPPALATAPARGLPRGDAILIGLAGATVVAFGLAAVRSIAAPVLLALVLTICVHPLRNALERRGVPRGLATGSVAAAVFLVLVAFMAALLLALAQFPALLNQYSAELARIGATFGATLANFGIGTEQVQTIVSGFDPERIAAFVTGLLGNVVGLTGTLVVIVTTLLLMAMDASYLRTLLRELEPTRPSLVGALRTYGSNVRRYMVTTTMLGVVQGALNGVALLLLGVPGAFLWGVLSFVGSFIPNIGYLIALIPPVIFGFLEGGWETAIAVVVVYTLVNTVVQGAIQSRLVSTAVALSQTITFVSVLVWTAIIGPIGALLATPLTLLVRMLLVDSDPAARWWRPLLGDVASTRALMATETSARKAARRARKTAPDA